MWIITRFTTGRRMVVVQAAEDEARAQKHQEARILAERERQRREDDARQALLRYGVVSDASATCASVEIWVLA